MPEPMTEARPFPLADYQLSSPSEIRAWKKAHGITTDDLMQWLGVGRRSVNSKPMTEERLAYIEAWVATNLPSAACNRPDVIDLVGELIAEVRRLRAALEDVSNTSDDYGIASAALGRRRI